MKSGRADGRLVGGSGSRAARQREKVDSRLKKKTNMKVWSARARVQWPADDVDDDDDDYDDDDDDNACTG